MSFTFPKSTPKNHVLVNSLVRWARAFQEIKREKEKPDQKNNDCCQNKKEVDNISKCGHSPTLGPPVN